MRPGPRPREAAQLEPLPNEPLPASRQLSDRSSQWGRGLSRSRQRTNGWSIFPANVGAFEARKSDADMMGASGNRMPV